MKNKMGGHGREAETPRGQEWSGRLGGVPRATWGAVEYSQSLTCQDSEQSTDESQLHDLPVSGPWSLALPPGLLYGKTCHLLPPPWGHPCD